MTTPTPRLSEKQVAGILQDAVPRRDDPQQVDQLGMHIAALAADRQTLLEINAELRGVLKGLVELVEADGWNGRLLDAARAVLAKAGDATP